jgi:hypothetical protein
MRPAQSVTPIVTTGGDKLAERTRGLAPVQATTDCFKYQRTGDEWSSWQTEKLF